MNLIKSIKCFLFSEEKNCVMTYLKHSNTQEINIYHSKLFPVNEAEKREGT
jgi:hypothetical protein